MNKLPITVVYAGEFNQQSIKLQLDTAMTIQEAIITSGILIHFPEIDLASNRVGIFGKLKSLSDTVSPGDRIEIYRPLKIDPKEARRTKAKKAKP